MVTLNSILKEIKKVPVNRLEELYILIHSFNEESSKITNTKNEILSFSGAFSEMSDNDYNDFIQHTDNTRAALFNRNIDL
jgi:hypothetical protein